MNQNHEKTKKILKIVGLSLIIIALVFIITGLIDFFGSMGSSNPPSNFWTLFIGFPFLGIGMALTLFGFQREISTYAKNESVPVINELGEEITPAVSSITKAIKNTTGDSIQCPSCKEMNLNSAKFCANCGSPLKIICPECNQECSTDKNFCENCGAKLK